MPLSRALVLALLLALLLAAGGCDEGGSSNQPGPDTSKLTPACFSGGSTPVLELGDGFTGATWNDPHVIKVDDAYWMYASANTDFAGAVQIYRLVSDDGENWTLSPTSPVLRPSPGEWDAGSVETPAVTEFEGRYHMFWTGYQPAFGTQTANDFRIGHAVSDDGVNWSKDATFIAGPTGVSGDFDEFIVAEPGPVVVDGTLFVYFSAVGVDPDLGTLQVIGRVGSTNGSTWGPAKLTVTPDQAVYPRGDGWIGYSTPNAVALDGEVHLFHDVANEIPSWTQVRLHHAVSADGKSDWTQDTEAIHRRGDFAWSAREIRSPHALLDEFTLRLYFAGDDIYDTGAWAIGMSTCDLSPD